jgi:hypothetical protein
MSPDRIRLLIGAEPFEPFTIVTGDGEEVDVLSREFVYLYPGGRTLVALTPKFRGAHEESDFEEHKIDVFLITKVITPIRRKVRRRRNEGG